MLRQQALSHALQGPGKSVERPWGLKRDLYQRSQLHGSCITTIVVITIKITICITTATTIITSIIPFLLLFLLLFVLLFLLL